MVNPILSANSLAAIGLPALMGSGTANASTINPELNNNFKELISTLLSAETSKENAQLALDVNSNEKIKAALYQAASLIYLNGDTRNIAALEVTAMANDMIVSAVMQNNSLSAAERPVFLRALKATAVEIVISGAENYNTTATALTDAAAASNKSISANPSVSMPGKTVSIAVNSNPVTPGITANATQTPADFEVKNFAAAVTSINISSSVVSPAVNGSAETNEKATATRPVVMEVIGKAAVPVATAAVSDASKVKITEQLLNLIQELENALKFIMVLKTETSEGNDKEDQDVKEAAKTVQTAKAKIEEIQNSLTTSIQDTLKAASLKEAVTELILSLNTAAAVISAAAPKVQAPNNDTAETTSSAALNLASQNNQNSQSGVKYALTASNQPQEFKSIVAKIIVLLNQLNGSLSVTNKQVYAARPDISLEMAVNTPAFQQVMTAQAALNANTAQAVLNVNTQQAVLNTNMQQAAPAVLGNVQAAAALIQTAIAPPQETVKAKSETIITATVIAPVKSSDALTADSVKIVPNVVLGKLTESNQDAPVKNIITDVKWVSDVIIKPAALNNEAATAGQNNQVIFDRVAEFARSIREQIVMRQVTSKIDETGSTSKVNEIKMVLRPENLGSVYIKLEHTSGEIKGTIQVTNDAVRETLRANLPELRAALGNIGMTVNNFDISMANSNTGSAFQDNGRNNLQQWNNEARNLAQENIDSGIDSFVNADGYLNYLA